MDERGAEGEARRWLRLLAPAKINLSLHVVGRRADGYHQLDGLVAFADIGDVVAAAPAGGLSLALDGPFAGALSGAEASENLVLRAARSLAERLEHPAGATLRLTKNLPVASGIGGGSSDAAATLRLLARLWGGIAVNPAPLPATPLPNPPPQAGEGRVVEAGERGAEQEGDARSGQSVPSSLLLDLARILGADVPACLHGRPAWLGGVGERLDPAPVLPPAPILLVNPGVPLATPTVFRARQGPFSAPARFPGPVPDATALARLLEPTRNDLAAPATRLVPAVAEILAALEAADGALIARMSGSGATCFALFASDAAAAVARQRIAAERPSWWCAAGRLMTRPAEFF